MFVHEVVPKGAALTLSRYRLFTTYVERALRKYKRKQVQAVSFRSNETIEYLCECMSMLALMRQEDGSNVFSRVSEAFG